MWSLRCINKRPGTIHSAAESFFWGRNYNSSFFFPTLSWSLSLRVRMKVVNPDSWFWRKKNMGHIFTNKAKQCIKNTLSFCIPAGYKLRSSCLVSVPHGRIETREQSLLLHCLIVPCSGVSAAPLQEENIHPHPTCQTLKRWDTEKKSLKLTGQGKICH